MGFLSRMLGGAERGAENKSAKAEAKKADQATQIDTTTEEGWMAEGESKERLSLQDSWEQMGSLDDVPGVEQVDKFQFVQEQLDARIEELAQTDTQDQEQIKTISDELTALDKDRAKLEVLYDQYQTDEIKDKRRIEAEKLLGLDFGDVPVDSDDFLEVEDAGVGDAEVAKINVNVSEEAIKFDDELRAYLDQDAWTRELWDQMKITNFWGTEEHRIWLEASNAQKEMWDQWPEEIQDRLKELDIHRKEGGNILRQALDQKRAAILSNQLKQQAA